jgi:general L-amino acid transport system permease protein
VLISGSTLFSPVGLAPVETALWGGFLLTAILSALGVAAGSTLGLALALGRSSTMPVPRLLATAYIETVRGVPLITVLFFAMYVFPLFLPSSWSNISEFGRAAVAIVLFEAAYFAEVIRAGLGAVPQGQHEAAKALGLNAAQRLRLVIFPQAFKISLPALIATTIGLVKDTSLIAVIGMFDLLGAARNVPSIPMWIGRDLEPLIFAALFYLAYVAGLIYLVTWPALKTGSSVLIPAAIIGAMAYGTYEFTSYAIMKDWHISLVEWLDIQDCSQLPMT